MSWNKPSSVPQPPPKKSAPPSLKRGLFAGLLLVALGALGLYLFSNGEADSRPLQKKGRGRIKEVTPAAAPTNKVEEVKKPKEYWEVDESQTNGFTRGQQRKWEIMRRPRIPAVHVERPKEKYEIFEHRVENELAFLLTLEPGTGIIGSPNYQGYREDFVQSCIDKIEIKPEDDDYTRNLKQAVIDAKKEIQARVKAGEDLVAIMKETREEMRKLAAYKSMLVNQLREMAASGEDEIDPGLAIEAANKMLEAKGIAPLKKSSIIKTKIKYMKESQK